MVRVEMLHYNYWPAGRHLLQKLKAQTVRAYWDCQRLERYINARQQHIKCAVCMCIAVAAAMRKFASTNSIKYNIALSLFFLTLLHRVLLSYYYYYYYYWWRCRRCCCWCCCGFVFVSQYRRNVLFVSTVVSALLVRDFRNYVNSKIINNWKTHQHKI